MRQRRNLEDMLCGVNNEEFNENTQMTVFKGDIFMSVSFQYVEEPPRRR